MWPSTYGVLAKLMGKFLDDLTYSEFPSLLPKLAANVTSLSGLVGGMVDMFYLPLVVRELDFFCRSRWTLLYQCQGRQSL